MEANKKVGIIITTQIWETSESTQSVSKYVGRAESMILLLCLLKINSPRTCFSLYSRESLESEL